MIGLPEEAKEAENTGHIRAESIADRQGLLSIQAAPNGSEEEDQLETHFRSNRA